MTVHIPADVLTAARTGDPEATKQILDAMEPRITEMARDRANRTGGDFDELAHTARIAVWELMGYWDGDPGEFVAHATRACEQALREV